MLKDEIISGILAVIAALSFFYIITSILEMQNRLAMETKEEQKEITERLDDLDIRLKAMDKTIVEHWKRYGKGR